MLQQTLCQTTVCAIVYIWYSTILLWWHSFGE